MWYFFPIFSPLVDLYLLDILDLWISSTLPKISSLDEYISNKHLFGFTYSPMNERNN